ncbi:1-deoxy-D-xylulose-5-phosphate synthase N-terminal domain-containing protein [Streptomyces sp. L7]
MSHVSRTGGHLGPNLGVVELTIALHRVFESPHDRLLWDTGHQAYVHTDPDGRQDFGRLRSRGGLSGLPLPPGVAARHHRELPCLDGSLVRRRPGEGGYRLSGETDRSVVAVVGDGALTGGMAWEALNNIALIKDFPLVVVVNDNGRSYARTRGGLADHLTALRTAQRKERAQGADGAAVPVREPGTEIHRPGGRARPGVRRGRAAAGQEVRRPRHRALHHREGQRTPARRGARGRPFPRGRRCRRAGEAPVESWTSVFSDELVKVGAARPEVVAITAAMLRPVGLAGFPPRPTRSARSTSASPNHTP